MKGRKREKRNSKNLEKVALVEIKPNKITQNLFIEKAVLDGKINPWQRREIAVYFKDMKLKEKEDIKVYEEVLKKY